MRHCFSVLDMISYTENNFKSFLHYDRMIEDMYFDTHAHYDDKAFDEDRDSLIAALPGEGISLVLNASSDLESSVQSVALAEKYPFIYAAVGIHPHEASTMNDEVLAEIRALAAKNKVVAIGEIGLDYYYDHSPREVQRETFRLQMALAQELSLPVIVHNRDAHEDSMEMVRAFPGIKGVFHCYSGSVEMARELIKLGWHLSFAGPVTFKNARKAPEVVASMPEDRLMIETDCPYLSPVPLRGRRNDSRNIKHIAARIAEIRGTTAEHIAEVTMQNGKRFFGID